LNEILIDVDGSPRGYVAWYNHSTNNSMIRTTRSLPKNIKFGVQRAEMIAIYYALKDNIELFLSGKISGKRKICIDVRSDSRSTIEQLQGISRIRDKKLLVMSKRIMRLLLRNGLRIVFHYVQRNMNIAGVILDLQRRGFL
jgi:ribonuclease HI